LVQQDEVLEKLTKVNVQVLTSRLAISPPPIPKFWHNKNEMQKMKELNYQCPNPFSISSTTTPKMSGNSIA